MAHLSRSFRIGGVGQPNIRKVAPVTQWRLWFFPLMCCPVVENHQRNEVSDAPGCSASQVQQILSVPIWDVETPFCYLPTNTIPRSSSHFVWQRFLGINMGCCRLQHSTRWTDASNCPVDWVSPEAPSEFNFKTYDDADTPTRSFRSERLMSFRT